ncbi:hypothetical protein [Rhizobium sp. RMa-01]|uniref:hypothetical protein n=1 Tax=Rhizobium sp. RMa-01 TaxID=2494255 RepID=UPI001FE2158C|nr:hypothetical protein [Rhizobium sp. RMa-01]
MDVILVGRCFFLSGIALVEKLVEPGELAVTADVFSSALPALEQSKPAAPAAVARRTPTLKTMMKFKMDFTIALSEKLPSPTAQRTFASGRGLINA